MDSPNAPARRSAEQGYVLVVLLMFAAVLLIGTSAIMRKAAFEGQRDRENELIFRGLQYQRAIQLYVRKVGAYPPSLDALEKTNGIRFLRKRYKDPMTKEGDWRLIHIGPNGQLIDSQVTVGGTTAATANPTEHVTASQFGQPGLTPAPPGAAPNPGSPGGLSQLPSQGGAPTDPALQTSSRAANQPVTGGQPGSQPTQPQPFGLSQPGGAPGGQQLIGGGGAIAGVASKSTADSIKKINDQTEYDKWEFTFDARKDPVTAAKLQGAQAPPQGTPPGTTTPPGGAFPPPGGANPPFGQQPPFGQPQPPLGGRPPSINNPGGGGFPPGITGPGTLPPPNTQR